MGAGAGVSSRLSDEVCSTAAGIGAAWLAPWTVTWPRAVTTPVSVRLVCRLSTLMMSPSAPLSIALPRVVR
ncbi:hypothetical protein ACVWWR_008531 [Bradyrhizobium sp. LM3.2]